MLLASEPSSNVAQDRPSTSVARFINVHRGVECITSPASSAPGPLLAGPRENAAMPRSHLSGRENSSASSPAALHGARRVMVQGPGPSARYAHTLALVANRFLVAMGGNDGKQTLGDAWALDTSDKPYQWRKITDAGEPPVARCAAAPLTVPDPGYMTCSQTLAPS